MALFDKFDDNRKARLLGAVRKGLRIGQACRAAGISRDTVYDYCKVHPEFKEQMNQAEADYCDEVENHLLAAAANLNMTAIIFWLTNRAPERWKDRRNQPQSAQPEAPVLAEILKRLQDKGGK